MSVFAKSISGSIRNMRWKAKKQAKENLQAVLSATAAENQMMSTDQSELQ